VKKNGRHQVTQSTAPFLLHTHEASAIPGKSCWSKKRKAAQLMLNPRKIHKILGLISGMKK